MSTKKQYVYIVMSGEFSDSTLEIDEVFASKKSADDCVAEHKDEDKKTNFKWHWEVQKREVLP